MLLIFLAILLYTNLAVSLEDGASLISSSQSEELIYKFLDKEFKFLSEENCSLKFKIPELRLVNPDFKEVKLVNYTGENFTLLLTYDTASPQRFTGTIYKKCLLPVLKTRVGRGEIIKEEYIYYKEYKIANNSTNVIKDIKLLVGKEAKQAIVANKLLTLNDIRELILVSPGKELDLLYIKKNLILQDKVRALEAGGEGETIKVKNDKTNAVLKAKIRDANTVIIEG